MTSPHRLGDYLVASCSQEGFHRVGIDQLDVFIGRESEQKILHASVEAATAGRSRLLLLSGSAGMGKTRTAEELARLARARGLTVLWGRCYEEDGAPPFWPWVQIVRAASKEIGVEAATLLGSSIADVAQLLPELHSDTTNSCLSLESAQARFRLFDAVAALLGQVASRAPALVILDDLHGADPSSLRLLDFVARDPRGPLLLLGCFRDVVASSHPLTATVAEALRLPGAQRLPLSGLTMNEVARFIELATGAAPETSLVAAIHQSTEGNPLFVREYVRMLQARGPCSEASGAVGALQVPHGVRAVVERRVAPLSVSCQRILGRAAAIGREFLLDVLSHLEPAEVVDSAVEEAQRAGLLIDGLRPDTYRFAHAVFREALYARLGALQRAQLHRQIGEALEGRADRDEHLSELASHFILATRSNGELAKGVGYARQASRRALVLLAYEEAERLLELALGALEKVGPEADRDRCAIRIELGIVRRATGDIEASKTTLLRAADVARRLGLRDELVRAALHFGTKLSWGDVPFVDPVQCELIEEALSVCANTAAKEEAALLARLAITLRFSPEHQRREEAATRALSLARQHDDPIILLAALHATHSTFYHPGNAVERLATAREMAALAERAGEREMLFQALMWRFDDCMELADRGGADSALAARERMVGELREPFCFWSNALLRASLLCVEGAFEDAERAVHDAVEIGRAANPSADLVYQIQIGHLALQRGDRNQLLASGQTMAAFADAFALVPVLGSFAARILAEAGEIDEARRRYEAMATDGFASFPYDQNWLTAMAQLAGVSTALGDRTGAEILYDRMLPFESRLAYGVGHGCALSPIALHLGQCAALLGRPTDACRHFETALAISERMRARPWLARIRFAYAGTLAQCGERERARTLVEGARTTAKLMQMPLLLESIDAAADVRRRLHPASSSAAARAREDRETVSLAAVGAVFRCEGDYWSVERAGRRVAIRNSKGLRYLLYLLRYPGTDILTLDLAARVSEGTLTGAPGETREHPLKAAANGPLSAVLDASAKAAYRRRLEELQGQLAEAEEFNDLGRAGAARREIQYLGDELRAATGLGGRNRQSNSFAERARSTVTKGVRAALLAITALDAELGHHLQACVKTGTYCCYTPPPSR